jgi:hypothetical protein
VRSDDLDALVHELNEGAGHHPGAGDPSRTRDRAAGAFDAAAIERWLERARAAGASDLLLVAGAPPMLRTAGRLSPADAAPLDGEDIEAAVLPLVAARLQDRYRQGQAVDVAFRLAPLPPSAPCRCGSRAWATCTSPTTSASCRACLAGWSSCAGRPGRARPRRSRPSSPRSTAARRGTSSRSKTRSSTSTPTA